MSTTAQPDDEPMNIVGETQVDFGGDEEMKTQATGEVEVDLESEDDDVAAQAAMIATLLLVWSAWEALTRMGNTLHHLQRKTTTW